MNVDPLRIELSAEQAVPSRDHIAVGRWRAHLGVGHVRRLNSIVTHGEDPGAEVARQRLVTLVDRYRAADLRPMVRQTSLDQWLEPLLGGWSTSEETAVMVSRPRRGRLADQITDQDWIDRIAGQSASPERSEEAFESLRRLAHRHVTHAAPSRHDPVAIGRAVLVDGLVGLYDIRTDPEARGQGFGRMVTESLIAWAHDVSAEAIYLQVSTVNAPATRLYRSLDFEPVYWYVYRREVNHPNGAGDSSPRRGTPTRRTT